MEHAKANAKASREKRRAATKEYNKAYRAAHKDEHLEKGRVAYRKRRDDPQAYAAWLIKHRFTRARSAARARGEEWSLTKEFYDAKVLEPCHYCANEMGEPVTHAIGLDRLDSARGYLPDNVVSCCAACNWTKGAHLTPEETSVAIQAILAYRRANEEKPEETERDTP